MSEVKENLAVKPDNYISHLVDIGIRQKWRNIGKEEYYQLVETQLDGQKVGGVEIYLGSESVMVYQDERGPVAISINNTNYTRLQTRDNSGKMVATMGRSSDNDLRLEDLGISRHHAKVSFDRDGQIEVSDLGSSRGTRARKLSPEEVDYIYKMLGQEPETVAKAVLNRLLWQGRIECLTVDESDWKRDPFKGKHGMKDIARTEYADQNNIYRLNPGKGRVFAGRQFNYVVSRGGDLFLGDRSALPTERGIKHRQLGRIAEKYGPGHRSFILGGKATIDGRGMIWLDDLSGSFHDLAQCQDRRRMEGLVCLLATMWQHEVTYQHIDGSGNEVFRVESKKD